MVVHFHLLFNVTIAVAFLFFTEKIALVAERLLPAKPDADDPAKPRYLDPSALDDARRWRSAVPRARRCASATSSSRC